MTKDMPCQHVLYQSYLCYSSIIKIRLVFVSIYNSQYHVKEWIVDEEAASAMISRALTLRMN